VIRRGKDCGNTELLDEGPSVILEALESTDEIDVLDVDLQADGEVAWRKRRRALQHPLSLLGERTQLRLISVTRVESTRADDGHQVGATQQHDQTVPHLLGLAGRVRIEELLVGLPDVAVIGVGDWPGWLRADAGRDARALPPPRSTVPTIRSQEPLRPSQPHTNTIVGHCEQISSNTDLREKKFLLPLYPSIQR